MKNKWIVFLIIIALASTLSYQGESHAVESPLTNGMSFLPPPPQENSPGFRRDKEIYQMTRAEKGTSRWRLAAFDADLNNNAGIWFKDAFGIGINQKKTPETYKLLTLLFKRLEEALGPIKSRYMRKRPYVYYNAPGSTCAPQDEKTLRNNGSYPSGHTALGWGMALLLVEISPEYQNAVFKRGYELGQSRVICGFHWQSDVDTGRLVASAMVARLHSDPTFTALLEKAKAEIARIRPQAK